MRWADLDLDGAVWSIPTTKSGRPHTVPLSAAAVKVLKGRQAIAGEGTFVFPASSSTGHVMRPWHTYSAILKRAEIKNLSIHDLRRSLGSWQTITGSGEKIVGRTLGHTTSAKHGDLQPRRPAIRAGVHRDGDGGDPGSGKTTAVQVIDER
jgi:integrase